MIAIGLPLAVMIILTFISMITDGGSLSNISGGINGTVFYFDANLGLIAVIITIITVGTVAGINVLGSGINDSSVKILTLGISYGSLWAIFSIFSYDLLLTIEVFGGILYTCLTVVYVYGVINRIRG